MNPAKDSEDYGADLIGKSISRHHFSNVATDIELFIDGVAQPGMPTSYFFRDTQQMNGAEMEAIRQCRGRVLDVGAGAGCHSLELQSRGFDVVALERSQHAFAVMLDRGVKNAVQLEVLQYETTGFDTILLLMNGFGIGGDEEGVIQLLSHAKKLLAPGGRILGDSTDIRYFKGEKDLYEMEHKPFCEVEFEVRVGDSSEFFPWIYPDEVLLEILAAEAGLQCRTLMYEDEFHFLSELHV